MAQVKANNAGQHFYNLGQALLEHYLYTGACVIQSDTVENIRSATKWTQSSKTTYHPSHDSRIVFSIGLSVLVGPDTHGV